MSSIRPALKLPTALTFVACLACGGGYSTVSHRPPDYAPAYGYRYHHPADHVLLIYDSNTTVYRVSGHPHWYYDGGHYYRVSGNKWYSTSRLHGKWTPVSTSSVPSGLHAKYKEKYVRAHHRTHYASGHAKKQKG